MELEFDVHVDANALYDYMLRHTFTKAAGILGSTAGALGIVAGMMQRYPIYVIFGAVVLLYQPVSLWLRAQKQALLPVFKEPLHYKMTEEGVEVSQKETQQFQKWEDMYRAVSTGKSLILYTDKIHASIFPRKDLGEKQSGARKGADPLLKGGRKEVAMIIESLCADDTFAFGKKLGEAAEPGTVYTLVGDLGVGKTVLTQGLAEGLGITEAVNSPTFTILQVYEEGRLPLYHFDVYRIGDVEEMDEIGYEDYFYGDGVCLIEWANLIEEILPEKYTEIRIEKDLEKGFDYRKITVTEVEA